MGVGDCRTIGSPLEQEKQSLGSWLNSQIRARPSIPSLALFQRSPGPTSEGGGTSLSARTGENQGFGVRELVWVWLCSLVLRDELLSLGALTYTCDGRSAGFLPALTGTAPPLSALLLAGLVFGNCTSGLTPLWLGSWEGQYRGWRTGEQGLGTYFSAPALLGYGSSAYLSQATLQPHFLSYSSRTQVLAAPSRCPPQRVAEALAMQA